MNRASQSLNQALQHYRAGRLEAAEQILRQVLRAHKDHSDARRLLASFALEHHRLGFSLQQQGRLDEAIACYRQAARFTPDDASIHINLGTALESQSRFEEAIASYQRALEIEPDSAAAYHNRGVAFEGQGKLDDALASYLTATRIKPDLSIAYNSIGNVYQKQGHFSESIVNYEQALLLAPDDPVTHANLGTVFQQQNCLDQAIACYQQALRLDPRCANSHNNLGIACLQAGLFETGWAEFEWRNSPDSIASIRQPKWDGSSLAGRRILLVAEGGLGNTLQFIRYAPLVKAMGAYVIFMCQPPLLPFLNNFAGIDEFVPVPTNSEQSLPLFDVHCRLMSLPLLLGTTIRTIPNNVPYLKADERLIQHWGRELSAMQGLRVGIAWQGNRHYPIDRGRSIPLSEFLPLGSIHGVELISLQKGDGHEQLQLLDGQMRVLDFADRMDESTGPFLDTAAIMMQLDLVMTSDTSVAHLAGALGIPVWVALKFSPDWRWLLDRNDSPWYPTMKLFRQPEPGDWPSVFHAIASELKSVVASRRVPCQTVESE